MKGGLTNMSNDNADVPLRKDESAPFRFDLGPVVSTPGALDAMSRNQVDPMDYLSRHARGDWGELCEEDKDANESSLKTGARILSAYVLPDGTKLWIITDAEIDEEHHRQATTFLLPSDY
jgi:hypothetical protein